MRAGGACVGHVDFILFVSFLFALGTQWNAASSGIQAFEVFIGFVIEGKIKK